MKSRMAIVLSIMFIVFCTANLSFAKNDKAEKNLFGKYPICDFLPFAETGYFSIHYDGRYFSPDDYCFPNGGVKFVLGFSDNILSDGSRISDMIESFQLINVSKNSSYIRDEASIYYEFDKELVEYNFWLGQLSMLRGIWKFRVHTKKGKIYESPEVDLIPAMFEQDKPKKVEDIVVDTTSKTVSFYLPEYSERVRFAIEDADYNFIHKADQYDLEEGYHSFSIPQEFIGENYNGRLETRVYNSLWPNIDKTSCDFISGAMMRVLVNFTIP